MGGGAPHLGKRPPGGAVRLGSREARKSFCKLKKIVLKIIIIEKRKVQIIIYHRYFVEAFNVIVDLFMMLMVVFSLLGGRVIMPLVDHFVSCS